MRIRDITGELNEGLSDHLKSWAKKAILAGTLAVGTLVGTPAQADHWQDNTEQDRIEYYREDGRGVFCPKHDANGQALDPQQVLAACQQAANRLSGQGQGQFRAPNHAPPQQFFMNFNINRGAPVHHYGEYERASRPGGAYQPPHQSGHQSGHRR